SNFFWFNVGTVKKAAAGKKVGDPQVSAMKYAWFSNPMFRRAMSMAVDRDAMIPSIFFGNGIKNWSTQTAGNKVWFNPTLLHYDHNVDESKRLLAGLGWKD